MIMSQFFFTHYLEILSPQPITSLRFVWFLFAVVLFSSAASVSEIHFHLTPFWYVLSFFPISIRRIPSFFKIICTFNHNMLVKEFSIRIIFTHQLGKNTRILSDLTHSLVFGVGCKKMEKSFGTSLNFSSKLLSFL